MREHILKAIALELDRHEKFLEDAHSHINSVMLVVKFKNHTVKGVTFQSQCEHFYD